MSRTGPTTLKQVAESSGVHLSTVSRALDPKKRHLVADDVVDRVTSIARKLGYQPNRLASSLRTGRSMLIGVLLPDISNPVFAPILGGITEALTPNGYAAIMADAGGDPSVQTAIVDNLINQRVSGLILAPVLRDDKVVAHCLNRDVPIILLNRFKFRNRISSVVSDDMLGMQLAVDYLVSMGHKTIGHVSGPCNTSMGSLRRDGFMHAMKRHRLTPHVKEASNSSREAGVIPAKALISEVAGITAIVAANDLLALGSFDAIRELGLRCPRDISVVGHNDMPLVELMSPALTTVRVDHREMGRESAKLLLHVIGAQPAKVQHITLPSNLIVRSSVRAV
jgi:LacI family transcriptional regulator